MPRIVELELYNCKIYPPKKSESFLRLVHYINRFSRIDSDRRYFYHGNTLANCHYTPPIGIYKIEFQVMGKKSKQRLYLQLQ